MGDPKEPKIEETKSMELTGSEWDLVLGGLSYFHDQSNPDYEEADKLIEKIKSKLGIEE